MGGGSGGKRAKSDEKAEHDAVAVTTAEGLWCGSGLDHVTKWSGPERSVDEVITRKLSL